jgi:hypothetical protein
MNCDYGGMPSVVVGAQAAAPHGYRQTSVLGSIQSSPGHTEDYWTRKVAQTSLPLTVRLPNTGNIYSFAAAAAAAAKFMPGDNSCDSEQ